MGEFIYALKADLNVGIGSALIKIGKTTRDGGTRFKEIHRDWLKVRKITFNTIAMIEVSDCDKAERALHRYYHANHYTGEQVSKWLGGKCTGDTECFLLSLEQISELRGMMMVDAPDYQNKSFTPGRHSPDDSDELKYWVMIIGALFAVGLFYSVGRSNQSHTLLPQNINATKRSTQAPQPTATPWTIAPLYDKPNGTPTGFGIPRGQLTTIVQRKVIGDRNWCQTPDVGWFKCE
jgi:hypothetical protein